MLDLPARAVHPVSLLTSHYGGFWCQKRFGVSAQDGQGAKAKPIRNGEALLPPWARKRCNITSPASAVKLSGIQGRLQTYMCGKMFFSNGELKYSVPPSTDCVNRFQSPLSSPGQHVPVTNDAARMWEVAQCFFKCSVLRPVSAV